MYKYVIKKVIGTKNDRELKKLRPMVARVAELEPKMKALKAEEFPASPPNGRRRCRRRGGLSRS